MASLGLVSPGGRGQTDGVTLFFLKKTGDLFSHHPFYLASPTFRRPFSSILYKFSDKQFCHSGVSLWMVSPGAVRPPSRPPPVTPLLTGMVESNGSLPLGL